MTLSDSEGGVVMKTWPDLATYRVPVQRNDAETESSLYIEHRPPFSNP